MERFATPSGSRGPESWWTKFKHGLGITSVVVAGLACYSLSALGQLESGQEWIGRWQVAGTRTLGPTRFRAELEPSVPGGPRLSTVEIYRTGPRGDWQLVALTVDGPIEAGTERLVAAEVERVWGVAKLEDPRLVAIGPTGGWRRAAWMVGGVTVTLQARLEEPNRMTAILRDRAGGPESIKQVDLVRVSSVPRVQKPDLKPSRFPGEPTANPRPTLPKSEVSGLFTIGLDGKNLRCVAEPKGFLRAAHPAWSPDGKLLAYVGFDETGRDPLIWVVAAEGAEARVVAAGIAPTWSRDGTRLAYVASGKPEWATDWADLGRNDERIEVLELEGANPGRITIVARGLWPRWSPTDDRLAFSARRDANWDIYLRGSDGLELRRLTTDPALDTRPLWMPDGRSVVFLSSRVNRWDLYKIAVDGREPPEQFTDLSRREEQADLSPDGQKLLFTERPGRPESKIWLLDLSSQTTRPLLDTTNGDRDPAWSPDGRTIAFVSRRPVPSRTPMKP